MANTCVDPKINIERLDSGGLAKESYTQSPSQTREMVCRLARTGGCWDATINVIRKINDIGNLELGDQILIYYDGNLLWRGWVDDFESKNNDLEIQCVGAWKAV